MLLPSSGTCLRSIIAVAVVLAAVFIRWAMIPILGLNTPYLTVYPVVMFISILLGVGPGVLASLVGVAAIETFVAQPISDYHVFWAEAARLVVVVVSAVYLGSIGSRLREAEAHARADADAARAAQAALRESETKFRTLADNMSQFAWMADEHGSIFWYNQRWYDYTGAEPSEMMGWGWQKAHHPDHVQRVVDKISRCFQSGQVWEDTFPLRGRDGQYRYFLSRAVPVRDEAGKVIRWFGTNTDITEMCRRQEEIQRLNRTLKALSDSSHAMSRAREESAYLADVCRIIAEDCGHLMVWIGYAEHDAARSVRPVAWSGFQDRYLERLRVSWANTELGRGPIGTAIRTGQVNICRDIQSDPRLEPWRDDVVRQGYASLIALPLLHDAQAFGVLVIYSREPYPFSENEVRLLTELAGDLACGVHAIRLRRANEEVQVELRRAKEEAERANSAKDRFLAVLSHELRTPLNPALLVATMIERSPKLPPDLREDVGIIRRNIELEARLIDDILDLTRIARGKIALDRRVVDGREILTHAVAICRGDAAEKSVTLKVDLPPHPVDVYADPARLQQVFWNLLKNAVKFTPAGGTIAVTAQATHDGGLRVKVTDTGRGIEKDSLRRIFDAFEQGGQDVNRRYGGLGLGLAICKSLVALHEGSIAAASDGPEKGATFTVNLPAAPAELQVPGEEPPPPEAALVPGAAGRGAILLVEDDQTTAFVIARLLQDVGYHVNTAHCVEQALVRFEQEPFDLVVSDIGLPDGTGRELLHALLLMRPVKAIALSGYGMETDLQQSAAAGFLEHLVKPISATQLEQAVERALANVTLPALSSSSSSSLSSPSSDVAQSAGTSTN